MPEQRPFATTRKHVVAPGQMVRIDLDLLTTHEKPELWTQPRYGQVRFLDERTLIYTCGTKLRTGSDGFMLRLPNGDNDNVSITVNPDFAQGPKQQARLLASDGPQPALDYSDIERRWPGLLDHLGNGAYSPLASAATTRRRASHDTG